MSGLWRRNPKTPEGKYPVVLRRDGTPLRSRYFVIALKDPAAPTALRAYAQAAEALGMDKEYVADIRWLVEEAECEVVKARDPKSGGTPADPTAPPHRTDDPVVLAWARSIGNPGG